jgi:hypothetical protein
MTEFEYIEATAIMAQLMVSAVLSYFTVLFAYIVSAHFAGKDLPRKMAVGLSLVYSLFIINPLGSYRFSFVYYFQIAEEHAEKFPNSSLIPSLPDLTAWTIYVGLAPLLIGWVASLYYMHFHIRK